MLSVFTDSSNWSCLKLARTKSSHGKYASLTQMVWQLASVVQPVLMIAPELSFLTASCQSAQGKLIFGLPEGPLARWLYCRAAAGPGWYQHWIWQHRCKRLHLPLGKAGPCGWGCLNLFPELVTSSLIQPEQVTGKSPQSRGCIFLICWFLCRHRQLTPTKMVLHVQMPLHTKWLFPIYSHLFWRVQCKQSAKGGKKSINQFLMAKCHFDGTDIFCKASINFNVLFCLFLKNKHR